jgi:hypothetical protein
LGHGFLVFNNLEKEPTNGKGNLLATRLWTEAVWKYLQPLMAAKQKYHIDLAMLRQTKVENLTHFTTITCPSPACREIYSYNLLGKRQHEGIPNITN